MSYIIRVLYCQLTTGHRYGAWESYARTDGRSFYVRACERCGWIKVKR